MVQAQSVHEETCRDVLGSQMWRDLGEYPTVKGNLVFAFYIDWFNPYTNKVAGKKVSVGAIILVCPNLPPDLRFKTEYLFFAGIIPGPSEPTVTTLNNILDPLVDEVL